MIIFDNDGEEVEIGAAASTATTTNKSALDFLLTGGVPLNEPKARYGPFVRNTKTRGSSSSRFKLVRLGEITIQ